MKVRLLAIALAFAGAPALAQDYVGDDGCSGCHANFPYQGFFDAYKRSGHPWKIFRTMGEVPPGDTWPWTVVPPLPVAYGEQVEWSGVEYVIGNFFWKARFIDREGYIYTGFEDERTQWNLLTGEFVPYHAGEVDKPFDCGRCHTTGYDPDGGNQHGLPGLIGTWEEDGVRCEACHGPASDHVASGGDIPPPGGKDCEDCHFRDSEFRMPWRNGFMRHHQQAEDISHSPHDFLDCSSCHNPHRSTVYEDGGSIADCSSCHPGELENGFYRVEGMTGLDCEDCHMPLMGKSGQNFNEYTGDIHGHLFRIMTQPIFGSENVYEDGGNFFWNQDENGDSAATLDYSCLGCHLLIEEPITIEQASAYAMNIHTEHAANPGDLNNDGVVDFADILEVLAGWGPCDPPPPADCRGDADRNGVVDFADILVVLANWGELSPAGGSSTNVALR